METIQQRLVSGRDSIGSIFTLPSRMRTESGTPPPFSLPCQSWASPPLDWKVLEGDRKRALNAAAPGAVARGKSRVPGSFPTALSLVKASLRTTNDRARESGVRACYRPPAIIEAQVSGPDRRAARVRIPVILPPRMPAIIALQRKARLEPAAGAVCSLPEFQSARDRPERRRSSKW
jgi:hypothetical protein